jgi:putative CocE/NonD family hydrolase
VGEEDAPGNEWRTADDWPPFPTKTVPFHLRTDGVLARDNPEPRNSHVSFIYDPDDPPPTLGGRTLYPIKEGPTAGSYPGPHDQARFLERADVLTFVSAPLAAPVEATGTVRAHLFVSTTAPDTDFIVKLVDIYPDGRHTLMLDGARRLKFRSGFSVPSEPPDPGEVAEVDVVLGTISLVFNAGHRIGIHVLSGNYPRYEKNPQDGRDFPDETRPCAVATNTVHLGQDYPSALLLPMPHEQEMKP